MSSEPTPLRVALGRHVQVELISKSGSAERLELDLVPDEQADFDRGFLGAGTPLARAILDQAAGQVVPYKMGDIVQVRLISVSPGVNVPPADAAEKRQALLRKAVDKSDLTNAISFALTFDTKWGDYDPEGLASNWEQGQAEPLRENQQDQEK